ncbi:oxidoreductase-like protein [Westerdykella ornata]|uniref:Oxidoreductase-like protein n=1 Tax=Westerdykella ornata TaxID=318751 RepID=A0A6A6JEB0_WESOR|nr:oxidoreductase-like protein [Westerdykella ornata]KAF2274950.1 oxidoreductase-like protein [Westerdykella ornata]
MAMPWNEGEERMQQLMHVPERGNPTATTLTPQAMYLLQRAPLLAIGTLDSQERPWTTLWGGQTGFSEHLGGKMIGTRTLVDGEKDPVVQALAGGATTNGEMIQGNDKMVSGLTIDLMMRKRVKLFGRVLAASLGEAKVQVEGDEQQQDGVPRAQHQLQLVTNIEQSLGNCPKYLNQYELKPTLVTSKLTSQSPSLSAEAKTLISQADMFFLTTSTPTDMDTNHRGGPAGFVRILSDTEIVYPEYSGNRFYQSLGNLQINPRIGLVFPNYDTGDVLYMTGTAEVLVLDDAAKLLPGSNLAVKITTEEVRYVASGLPFRGIRNTPSPYNPAVRTLASEGNIKASYASCPRQSATLIDRTLITPTIARLRFSTPEGISYKPGQWVALDFSKELDMGYSHMRDDDPTSLNDDFIRTFTISSKPDEEPDMSKEFEITIRKVGPVTSFLFRTNDIGSLQIPVLGVGGEFYIERNEKEISFVAGGVGITPLLSQWPSLSEDHLTKLNLFWSIRAEDIDFVADVFERYPGLARRTQVYLTGYKDFEDVNEKIKKIDEQGATVRKQRLTKDGLNGSNKWYICASKGLRKVLLEWLEGKDVEFEDFDY